MKMIKVYDSSGKHVDSFAGPVTEEQLNILNCRGFYIRGQLTARGKGITKRAYMRTIALQKLEAQEIERQKQKQLESQEKENVIT